LIFRIFPCFDEETIAALVIVKGEFYCRESGQCGLWSTVFFLFSFFKFSLNLVYVFLPFQSFGKAQLLVS
jgi:hypothetical protein